VIKTPLPTSEISGGAGHSPATYHCGTLTYTKVGLVVLFAWLLWGDFCFTLMETVVPSVLPLKLKDLGCSNLTIGLILSTIPGLLNMTICPYVSFKSDRYRSKWGRRIPFILWTMPFLCACLALLGWSDDLSLLLRQYSPYLRQIAPTTLTIALIGVFMTMFTFFNMFVGSVFWYLFNDVVPPQFLARFVGMFRIVGTAASALYSYFIFKYAESNMREIMLGAAVLYLVGFGLVCFMVKEGHYPPFEEPDPDAAKRSKFHVVEAFLKESFSNKFYWLIFGLTGIQAAGGAIGVFGVFFSRQMGLTLDQIGKLGAIMAVASLVAMYFTAIFIDRWHPLRVSVYLTVFGVAGTAMSWVWIFVTLPGTYYFWLSVGIGLVATFQGALGGGCVFPRDMRIFPQSRFGQFCSAQALFRSFCTLAAGLAAGAFIDLMKYVFHGSDFAYRFIALWNIVFAVAAAVIALFLYRKWYELGGDAHYHPPASWSPTGVEEMPIVTTVGPQSFWVSMTLHIYQAIMLLSILLIPPLMYWMNLKQMSRAFFWHGAILLPASVAIWLLWKWVEIQIRRDMKRSRNGEPLRNGIIHHGCAIAVGIQFLLMIPIWSAQVVVTVNLHMETGAILFTVANLVTNLTLIGSMWMMARIERGRLTHMDGLLAVATP
jgi:Na+/melibiose symporter-like transporter